LGYLSFLEFGILIFGISFKKNGGLAQLARAPALHAGGHRFDSDILHNSSDIRIDRLQDTGFIYEKRRIVIGSVLFTGKTFIDILRIRIREKQIIK
jgi:hypothetical protein